MNQNKTVAGVYLEQEARLEEVVLGVVGRR